VSTLCQQNTYARRRLVISKDDFSVGRVRGPRKGNRCQPPAAYICGCQPQAVRPRAGKISSALSARLLISAAEADDHMLMLVRGAHFSQGEGRPKINVEFRPKLPFEIVRGSDGGAMGEPESGDRMRVLFINSMAISPNAPPRSDMRIELGLPAGTNSSNQWARPRRA